MTDKLTAICGRKDISSFNDVCDGTCTPGFDTDGVTGQEIYENGIRLGRKLEEVPGSRLFSYRVYPHAIWYFVYRDEDVLAKLLESLPDKS